VCVRAFVVQLICWLIHSIHPLLHAPPHPPPPPPPFLILLITSRGVGARKGLRHAKQRTAALQALVRKRQKVAELKRKRAAQVVIGRHARGCEVRRRHGKHATKRKAAVKAQAAIRGVVYLKRGQRRLQQVKAAQTKVAAFARKRLAFLEFKACVRAVVVVQAGQRAVVARKTHSTLKTLDRLQKEKERKKARLIQAAVRRNQAAALYQAKRRAATVVANLARKAQAKAGLAAALKACLKLQSRARVRRQVLLWRRAQDKATLLQAFARKTNALKRLRRQKRACERIKRAYKAFSLNGALAQALEEAHSYACKGQRERLQRLLTYDTAGFGGLW
jgi:hypothetical protein